jgi:hypothetical protein
LELAKALYQRGEIEAAFQVAEQGLATARCGGDE